MPSSRLAPRTSLHLGDVAGSALPRLGPKMTPGIAMLSYPCS